MKTVEQMLKDAEQTVIDCLLVPNEWLPESYRGKKSHRKLRSVVNEAKRRKRNLFKEDREVSVKFDNNRNVVAARPGRLAVLEKYAADVAAGKEIDYDINEDRLYRNQLDFCTAAIKAGVFEADEFDVD